MNRFQVGNQISILNEALKGEIIQIEHQRANVLLEDGFNEWYPISQLIHVSNINIEDISLKDPATHVEVRKEKIHEVDLHIENLTVHFKSIEPQKILNYQISSFYDEYTYARGNSYDSMIVIHGKGQGILRDTILKFVYEKGIHYEKLQHGKYKNAALKLFLTTAS